MKFFSKAFDFLIPRFCVSCNSLLLTEDKYICGSCFPQINILSDSDIKLEFERKVLVKGIEKKKSQKLID